MQPHEKFAGESVAQASFTPKKFEPMKDFKPDDKPVNMDGEFDFNTVTHLTYQTPEVKPCRAAVYMMQQELKQQRAAEQQAKAGNPTGLTIAAN